MEKGTKINFKAVEDLAEVWCEWSEMELRHEWVFRYSYAFILSICYYSNYDEAIRVMQRATALPKNTKINYHDHVSSGFNILQLLAKHTILGIVSASSSFQVAETLVILC